MDNHIMEPSYNIFLWEYGSLLTSLKIKPMEGINLPLKNWAITNCCEAVTNWAHEWAQIKVQQLYLIWPVATWLLHKVTRREKSSQEFLSLELLWEFWQGDLCHWKGLVWRVPLSGEESGRWGAKGWDDLHPNGLTKSLSFEALLITPPP